MREFQLTFAALLAGSLPLLQPRLKFVQTELDGWETAGDHVWTRAAQGRRPRLFRPTSAAPTLKAGRWGGAPRLRRPLVMATTSAWR